MIFGNDSTPWLAWNISKNNWLIDMDFIDYVDSCLLVNFLNSQWDIEVYGKNGKTVFPLYRIENSSKEWIKSKSTDLLIHCLTYRIDIKSDLAINTFDNVDKSIKRIEDKYLFNIKYRNFRNINNHFDFLYFTKVIEK